MVLQVGDTQNSKKTEEKNEEKLKAPGHGIYAPMVAYMPVYLMILRTQYQVSKKSKRNQRAGSPSIYANPQGIYAYVYVHMLGHFKNNEKSKGNHRAVTTSIYASHIEHI